jgi:hypothetical protein
VGQMQREHVRFHSGRTTGTDHLPIDPAASTPHPTRTAPEKTDRILLHLAWGQPGHQGPPTILPRLYPGPKTTQAEPLQSKPVCSDAYFRTTTFLQRQ